MTTLKLPELDGRHDRAPAGEIYHPTEHRRVKAADIDEADLLRHLAESPLAVGPERWCMIWDIAAALRWYPERVVTAKLRRLRDRGLVDGCDCGCRGDWHLTPAGKVYVRDLSFGSLPTPGFGAWR